MELPSSKNKNFKKGTFRARKLKKTPLKKLLIFWEMELCSPKLKKTSYTHIFFQNISGGTSKAPKAKIYFTTPKKVMNK